MSSKYTKGDLPNNNYTVCLVHDNDNEKNRGSKGISDLFPSNIFIKFWARKKNNKNSEKMDDRYIIIISKKENDSLDDKFYSENKVTVSKYKCSKELPGEGKTYALYITFDTKKTTYVNFKNNLSDIFINFNKNNFIIDNSYNLYFPLPYSEEKPRNYAIITFDKINNMYPIKYITKIKDILNDYVVDDTKFTVNWAVNKVTDDIIQKNNKNSKKKN